MSIKVIAERRGNPVVKCFNYKTEEEGHRDGKIYDWNTFKMDCEESNPLNITCLTCGRKHPRKEITFSKFKEKTVHLCIKRDGHRVTSRCGVYHGNLLDGSSVEVDHFNENNIACKKCGRRRHLNAGQKLAHRKRSGNRN